MDIVHPIHNLSAAAYRCLFERVPIRSLAACSIKDSPQGKDVRPSTSDLSGARPTYIMDFLWNLVSNQESSSAETETFSPGHHGLTLE
ncbi:hypothetical protein AVEN_142141-1 [Araneus ventricosus]|uniref:Uncharacterized protein n=1 Tax=Araneus ventricosus TaxID=182803 RepID=A0A4Y2DHI2_ARAVE|nr:hypothetical protein AVEN_142141-1 [Araneus ventricosus]